MTPTTPEERDALIEATTTAHRARDPFTGRARAHEAWHDLDEEGRRRAFEETMRLRAMESALDPDGMSTTAHAVLARLARGP
jgi:hypothetical protein